MHRQDGPSLPLGQQLRWLLQPEVFPAVPRLRILGLRPRANSHGLARSQLHGQKLPSFLDHAGHRPHSCRLFLCRPVRTICGDHVFRSSTVHLGE